jgi:hypothetical protein
MLSDFIALWTKVTGPNNGYVLNMGTPEKIIEIFCFAHRTHYVSVQKCKRVETTALAVVVM